jgi:hypothetical protein
MTECEDLELKRGPAPEGSEKRGQKSGQKVPGRESKGKRQLSVYQSDRVLREPQFSDAKIFRVPVPSKSSQVVSLNPAVVTTSVSPSQRPTE